MVTLDFKSCKNQQHKAQRAFKAQRVNKCLKRVGELDNERKCRKDKIVRENERWEYRMVSQQHGLRNLSKINSSETAHQ